MPPRLPRRRRKEPRPHRDRASEMCPQRHWFVENRLSDGGHALRCNTRSSECSSYVQISNDLRPPARNNQPTHRSFASSSSDHEKTDLFAGGADRVNDAPSAGRLRSVIRGNIDNWDRTVPIAVSHSLHTAHPRRSDERRMERMFRRRAPSNRSRALKGDNRAERLAHRREGRACSARFMAWLLFSGLVLRRSAQRSIDPVPTRGVTTPCRTSTVIDIAPLSRGPDQDAETGEARVPDRISGSFSGIRTCPDVEPPDPNLSRPDGLGTESLRARCCATCRTGDRRRNRDRRRLRRGQPDAETRRRRAATQSRGLSRCRWSTTDGTDVQRAAHDGRAAVLGTRHSRR